MDPRTYIAIDLKSFYASVECAKRRRDPLTTHLVVADPSRTEKTICLAVSPSLKAYGIPGRARLFEVVQKMKEVNQRRLSFARQRRLLGDAGFKSGSDNALALEKDPSLRAEFIIAPPRMKLYEEYSTRIYSIYLKYVSPEDIHVYSIDECFIDVTSYLHARRQTARELARTMIADVLASTGITATAGIGTNLYLAKVAMDIVAKHVPADSDGVRIAELDEMSYRDLLWAHRPLTNFWRIGRGYARRLEKMGYHTMGDIARASLDPVQEDILYDTFGINAELLIDHAWGWEPTLIKTIREHRPDTNSISSGQVLQCPYEAEKARLIVREMAELLSLDLVRKNLVTSKLVLTVGYDMESLEGERGQNYKGEVVRDWYGRYVPKHAHGTINLDHKTSSGRAITQAMDSLYERIVDPELLVRRMYVVAADVTDEAFAGEKVPVQMDLFTDYSAIEKQREEEKREKRMQEAILKLQGKFGKNAVLKGMNLQEGATTIQRNNQIGGHRAE